MEIEEWFSETDQGKRKLEQQERAQQKEKQLWERVSARAKKQKQVNRKSKRDIEREVRIGELGGTTINVEYGQPLSDFIRGKRQEVEWDLKYPKRKEKRVVDSSKRVLLDSYKKKTGSARSEKEFLYSVCKTAKIRANGAGIPFELDPKELQVPSFCPVLGIELFWGDRISNNTPSLDRVVPAKGYTKDNVRVISMKANRLKNNATIEELEKILQYMRDHSDTT